MAETYSYTQTSWHTGDPITQEKMNKIEEGIANAHSAATTNSQSIDNVESSVTTMNTTVGNHTTAIQNIQVRMATIGQESAQGAMAWTQVRESIEMSGDNVTKSLNRRLSDTEGLLSSVRTEVREAHRDNVLNDSLKLRFQDIEASFSDYSSAITRINNTFVEASGSTVFAMEYGSVDDRMEADEGRIKAIQTILDEARQSTAFDRTKVSAVLDNSYASLDARLEDGESRIVAMQTELANARESTALGKTGDNKYGSIDERFEAIEGELVGQTAMSTRLDTIENNVSGLSNGKVNKADIATNLTTDDDTKVLSAKQGKALKDALDDMDTAYKAADTALDGRLDAIDGGSALDTTGGTLAARVAALETEVDMTSTDSRIDTALSRIEAMDNASTGSIAGLDTRIGALETTVDTSTTGLKDRMTAAENAISHTASGSDAGGLTQRLTKVEGDIETASTGIKARITSLETTVNTTTTGLVDKVSTIESDLNTASTGLKARVTALEGKDTIVIDAPVSGSNYTNDIPNSTAVETPSANADYLIADDNGKYFYWRYINNNWKLISSAGEGGGGTGSSSGMFISSLDIFEGENAPTPDENIDYFVGNNTIGYTHYRYLIPDGSEVGSFVRILPKGLLLNASVNANGGIVAGTVENPSTNVFNSFVALKSVDSEVVTDTNGNASGTKLTFVDTNGISYPITVQGGGGGGSLYTAKLNNEMGSLILTVPDVAGTVTNLQARVVIKEGADIAQNLGSALTITTQYRVSTNDAWNTLESRTVENNTSFNVNISSILRTGIKTYVRLVLTTTLEKEEITRTINYEVTKVEMSISAVNFNPATVRTGNLVFQYKCLGADLEKTVHFKIDGTDAITPVVTSSHNDLLQQTISLTGKSAGMHSFQVYFTVNGVSSNILNYYILYNNNTTNTEPMIALAANRTTITYGDELAINYTTAVNSNVESMDEVILELYTVESNVETVVARADLVNVRNERVHTWIPTEYPTEGTAYVRGIAKRTIDGTVHTDTKTIEITINELVTDYDLSYAGTENLLYSYTAYGRTNQDADKEQFNYTYTSHASGNPEITWTGAFNNFNWSTDGYPGTEILNEDGTTSKVYDALYISGGATHTINVPVLDSEDSNHVSLEIAPESYTDPTQNGRTIEIEYEVQSATDLNDVIIDCMDNNHVGFRVTPQSCYLLNNNVNVSLAQDGTGTILNEDAIAAAYLTTGVRTHLAFVIEPWAESKAYDKKYHQSVNIYINGEFANACPYNRDSNGNISDSFKTNATIRIGSASCIIKVYSIKLYNRGLTHTEVLQNYKMAPGATTDKIARFDANDLIRNSKLNYELARKKFNCLLLVGPEPDIQQNQQGQNYNARPTISPYKGSPSPIGRTDSKGNPVGKTESGLILTYPDGENIDGYKTEFRLLDKLTDGGYASSNNVQGTSSQKYPIHNLKVYLAKGKSGTEVYENNDPENGEFLGYTKSEKVKYKLPGAKGKESTLCWKADYMSTDHANTFNANIADTLFTDSLNPDITSEDWRSNIQNTVHGIRCLLFKQEGTNAPEFVADGCLNNDKGNSKSYGLEYPEPDDPNEIDPNAEYDVDGTADTVAQKWEFTNNSDDLGFFKYDCLFYPIGNDQHYRALDAFESCYPDQGDLDEAQADYKAEHNNVEDPTLNPNYNHLQLLLTWVSQRANYWDADPTPTGTVTYDEEHDTYTTTGTVYTYNGIPYSNMRDYKKAIFKREFTLHFNLDHVLVYYLFSEYVALCDNRVKNMFMRSDTVRKETIKLIGQAEPLYEGNSNPNANFWKEFVEVDTGEVDPETGDAIIEHRVKNANQIDWEEGEGHSHFARWAPVLYDLDSCFGVENVGLLKIPYDADWQYYSEGQYRFNGHDSIFWLMVEDSFQSELAAKALTLYNRSTGLNYNTFYQQQIVGNNNAIAPAMTNQDMLLKFDAPWATGFMNYSNTPPTYETPEYKYLQRGSRATQKDSFIFKRSMLLSSKYQTDAFKNDKISFRYGADLTAAQAVIECSANQNMYPAVSFGDNKGWTQALKLVNGTDVINGLVKAGDKCRIQATSSAKGQDTLFIAGASVLTDIGDLSVFKPYELKVGQGKNLKKLIIGSNASGYTNAVTTAIENISACSILEEVNIRNCTAFTSLDLSANGLIKRVYTAGSGAGTVSLPAGGVLDTIEYSTAVSNITILNHIYLQNFSCEVEDGETEAQYSNLNKLWIENTPNIPVVDIVLKRMAYLTNGLRLIGINVNLGADATFLETITSSLANGKYLDSTGSLNTNRTPEITGSVTIASIRSSLYNTLRSMYPNLTINTNEVVQEFEVVYKNYDNTVLFTDHGTNEDPLKDPVYDINPITGQPYIEMPTKPQDAEFKYYFGTYDNQNRYRKFSGWVRQGTTTNPVSGQTINGSLVLVAYYPTTVKQRYTVTWYNEANGQPVGTPLEEDYGTDLSNRATPIDTGDLPRVRQTGNAVKVFKGWSRPLGKLTEDVNVYGQWQTSYINDATSSITMGDLTAADLYAITQIQDTTAKNTLLKDHIGEVIFVPMGHDFEYTEGVNMVNLLGASDKFVLDTSPEEIHIYNDIKPLYTNSDWTIALDYKFLFNSANKAQFRNSNAEYVLMSCYQNADSAINGFKLSLVKDTSGNNRHMVQVSWGTTTVTIDYIYADTTLGDKMWFYSYRNVVVLSHNTKEPNKLRVSYVAPNTGNSYANGTTNYGSNYGTYVTNTQLEYSSNTTIDVPLIIGGNYNGNTATIEPTTSSFRRPAEGVIYWAKYWNTDLGTTNCQKLASWIHETVPFYLSGFNGTGDSGITEQIYENTALSFVAAQGMGDRYAYALRTNNDEIFDENGYYGYSLTGMSNICNNLIYNGLPEVYQSIVRETYIRTRIRHSDTGAYSTAQTYNYMFLPSVREVDIENESVNSYGDEVNGLWTPPWHWMVAADRNNMFGFVSGQYNQVERKTPQSASSLPYMASYLYRFLGKYIADDARIFATGSSDPAGISDLQLKTGNTFVNISVRSGDVWIDENNEAYIYFTDAEIAEGARVDIATTTGGWKKANIWNLRSIGNGQSRITENSLMRVGVNGQLTLGPATTQLAEQGRLMCPEFTI